MERNFRAQQLSTGFGFLLLWHLYPLYIAANSGTVHATGPREREAVLSPLRGRQERGRIQAPSRLHGRALWQGHCQASWRCPLRGAGAHQAPRFLPHGQGEAVGWLLSWDTRPLPRGDLTCHGLGFITGYPKWCIDPPPSFTPASDHH